MPLFTNTTGFPPLAIGPAGNSTLVGCHTLQFGDPSTIATHYGLADITASITANGRYFLRGPQAPVGAGAPRSVRMFAVHSPVVTSGSGAVIAQAANLNPGSGTYEIHLNGPSSTNSFLAAKVAPSGSYVDIFWYVSPVTGF